MSDGHSDALVFFGATGDLAYKKIFPALQAMVKRGRLDVPVIGVAKAGWGVDELRARARDSVEQHGSLRAGDFLIDLDARRVYVGASEVRLTGNEFDLFVYLARRPDHVVPY